MRKLLHKLQDFWIKEGHTIDDLTKWQRNIIYNFIIDYIREVTKNNDKRKC